MAKKPDPNQEDQKDQDQQADPAADVATKDKQVKQLWVRVKAGFTHRYRAGRRWTQQWESVDLADLSKDDVAALKADAQLMVMDKDPNGGKG